MKRPDQIDKTALNEILGNYVRERDYQPRLPALKKRGAVKIRVRFANATEEKNHVL